MGTLAAQEIFGYRKHLKHEFFKACIRYVTYMVLTVENILGLQAVKLWKFTKSNDMYMIWVFFEKAIKDHKFLISKLLLQRFASLAQLQILYKGTWLPSV